MVSVVLISNHKSQKPLLIPFFKISCTIDLHFKIYFKIQNKYFEIHKCIQIEITKVLNLVNQIYILVLDPLTSLVFHSIYI